MTADEYLAIGETADRYELVDGVVVMAPSAQANHNEIAAEIAFQFRTYAKIRPLRVFPETDIRLANDRVYRPDISVYLAERLIGPVKRLTTPPDLIVEMLTQSTRLFDLVTKREDYARSGVREYWVVDPADGSVRQFVAEPPGGPYSVAKVAEGERLGSMVIEGFTLDLAPIRVLAG